MNKASISILIAGCSIPLMTLRAEDKPASTSISARAEILTPPAPATPRVNGPNIFGVRPKHPFFYAIPTTGDRPMEYAVENLPAGLALDSKTGIITGKLAAPGDFSLRLIAKNKLGSNGKRFTIKCGEAICLTPPMGWNSWMCS